jgi:hypothetical protein
MEETHEFTVACPKCGAELETQVVVDAGLLTPEQVQAEKLSALKDSRTHAESHCEG